MASLILRDDWYDAETGRYHVVIRSPHGAPHRLSFWCQAAAWAALNRLMRKPCGAGS